MVMSADLVACMSFKGVGTSPKVRGQWNFDFISSKNLSLYDTFLRRFVLSSSWWIVFRIKIVLKKERKDVKNNFGWKVRDHGPRGPSRSYAYGEFKLSCEQPFYHFSKTKLSLICIICILICIMRSRITRRSDVSARETRATVDGRLEVPRARTEFARRSFCARAVRAWNELPGDVRRSPTFATFRNRLAGVFET